MTKQFYCLLFFCISIKTSVISQTWHSGTGDQTNNAGSGTSYSVAKPTNVVAGNLVVLILTQQRSTGTLNTSAFTPALADGFTLIGASAGNTIESANIAVYGKIATATEPNNYTGTVVQNTNNPNWKAVVTRVTGHNPIAPFGQVSVANTSGSNVGSIALPSMRIETQGSLLIAMRSVRRETSADAATSPLVSQLLLNGVGTSNSLTAQNDNAPSLHIATQSAVAINTSSGTRQFSWTGGARVAAIMFSINPAPSTTVPISSISTNFNGYWRSNIQFPSFINTTQPNTSHELLSFSLNGNTYSTGVNDNTLVANNVTFTPGNYRALPIAGLQGSLPDNTSNTLLAMASLRDGSPTSGVASHPNIFGKTIRNVMTDGVRGLDLGTGVTNLPSSSVLTFDIYSIDENKISEDAPALVVSQIAFPDNSIDRYDFLDANNNIVGTTVELNMTTLPSFGDYRLDLFSLTQGALNNATPWGGLFETANTVRPIRMAAFRLSDFGITISNFSAIRRFRIRPSGNSDPAFVAYNANAVNFRPIVSQGTSSTAICTNGTANMNVIVTAANEGNLTFRWQESTNNGTSWSDLSNGGNYSGVSTTSLTVTNAVSGRQYRCVVREVSSFTDVESISPPFTISNVSISAPTITTQPAGVSGCTGLPFSLFVTASGGTGVYTYQWNSGTSATGPWSPISGATNSTYFGTIGTGPVHYQVVVSNFGCPGSTTSGTATITTSASGPVVTTTGAQRCDPGTLTLAASTTSGTLTWRNGNGDQVATGNSFTTPTLSTTTNYFVTATDGSCTSSTATVTATIFTAQVISTPLNTPKIPTGNPLVFEGLFSNTPVSVQWQKDLVNLSGETASILNIPTAELSDNGSYRLQANFGTCQVTSNAVDAIVVVDLYSKLGQPLNLRQTWGVETDGSGSDPVTFTNGITAVSTRADHIFHAMHNEATTGNITLAGTFDVENALVTITPGTTFTSGVIRRLTGTTGAFTGSLTSSLSISGITGNPSNSALYFNQENEASRSIQNLENASTGTTTVHNPLRIIGKLAPTNGFVVSNGNITLVSNSSGTAMVTERPSGTGNYIQGDVIVERFIPGIGTDPLNGPGRRWRLFTIPVIKPGENIRYHWAANRPAKNYALESDADEPEGDGTIITGHGARYRTNGNLAKADGFDWFTGLNYQTVTSLRFYTNTGGTTGTWGDNNFYEQINTPHPPLQGYMLFVRGDRKMASGVNGTGRTTLRPRGELKMGTQTLGIPTPTSQSYVVFGNPYAAPLDMDKVLANTETSNNNTVHSEFYVWDSYLPNNTLINRPFGNWRVISKDPMGTWTATPNFTNGETHITHLQSSQAVMLRPKANGTLTIRESHKSENITSVTPFSNELVPTGGSIASFSADLGFMPEKTTTPIYFDGVKAYADKLYSYNTNEAFDMPKMNKFQGNLSVSLKRNSNSLTVEALPLSEKSDTIFLEASGLAQKMQYAWKINHKNFSNSGRSVYLIDSFTNNEILIPEMLDYQYNFATDSTIFSSSPSRFKVVIKNNAVLPLSFVFLNGLSTDNGNLIEWKTGTPGTFTSFIVERSGDGINFQEISKVIPENSGSNAFNYFDAKPISGNNYYRIAGVLSNGSFNFSGVLLLKSKENGTDKIQLYPNPVKNKQLQILWNGLERGQYQAELFTIEGKVLYTQNLKVIGDRQQTVMPIPQSTSKGYYLVRIKNDKGELISVQRLLVE